MSDVKFGLIEDDLFIFKNYPIVSYKKYLHDFVKQPAVKYCPGLTDYYASLYIMPMWFDLEIYFDEQDRILVECNDYHRQRSIGWHAGEWANTREHFGKQFWKDILKLSSPWAFKAPKGDAIMIRALDYHYDNHFVPISGIQYDVEPVFTSPILIRQDLGNFRISAGDPLLILEIVDPSKKISVVKDDKELMEHTKYFMDMRKSTIPKAENSPRLDDQSSQGMTQLYNKLKGK